MFEKTNMPLFLVIEEVDVMKLKYKFEFVDMENNEIIAVPVGNNAHKISGIVRLNNSGREIVEMLGEEISIETIVDNLSKKYENKQETIIEYVNETLEALRRYDLIEE